MTKKKTLELLLTALTLGTATLSRSLLTMASQKRLKIERGIFSSFRRDHLHNTNEAKVYMQYLEDGIPGTT